MQYSTLFLPSMYFRNDNLEDGCLLPWLLQADTLEGSKSIVQGMCLAKNVYQVCVLSSLASPSNLVQLPSNAVGRNLLNCLLL